MKISKQKALGITLNLQLLLYCISSLALTAASGKLSGNVLLALSCITSAVMFSMPCLTYNRLTETPVSMCLTAPITPNGRTRNLPKNVITFVIALSITLTAVNVVGALTEAIASFFGIKATISEPTGLISLSLTFVRSVLLAAFFEELLFRGVVLNSFESTRNSRKLIMSALLFALMHYNLLSFFYAFAAGAVLSYFAIRTGSVIFTMLVHFAQNLTVFTFTVLREYLKADVFNTVSSVSFIIVSLIALLGTVILTVYELNNPKKSADISPSPTENHKMLPRELVIYIVLATLLTLLNF